MRERERERERERVRERPNERGIEIEGKRGSEYDQERRRTLSR